MHLIGPEHSNLNPYTSLPSTVDVNSLKSDPKSLANLLISASKDPVWCQAHTREVNELVKIWRHLKSQDQEQAGQLVEEVNLLCRPYFCTHSGNLQLTTPEDSFLGLRAEQCTISLAKDKNQQLEIFGSPEQAELALELMRYYRLHGADGANAWINSMETNDTGKQEAVRICYMLTLNQENLKPLNTICEGQLAKQYAPDLQTYNNSIERELIKKFASDPENRPAFIPRTFRDFINHAKDEDFMREITDQAKTNPAWTFENLRLLFLLGELSSHLSEQEGLNDNHSEERGIPAALLLSPVRFEIGTNPENHFILPRLLLEQSSVFQAALQQQKPGYIETISLSNYSPQVAHYIFQYLQGNISALKENFTKMEWDGREFDKGFALLKDVITFADGYDLPDLKAAVTEALLHFNSNYDPNNAWLKSTYYDRWRVKIVLQRNIVDIYSKNPNFIDTISAPKDLIRLSNLLRNKDYCNDKSDESSARIFKRLWEVVENMDDKEVLKDLLNTCLYHSNNFRYDDNWFYWSGITSKFPLDSNLKKSMTTFLQNSPQVVQGLYHSGYFKFIDKDNNYSNFVNEFSSTILELLICKKLGYYPSTDNRTQ